MKRSFAIAAVAALFMAMAAPAVAKGPPPGTGPEQERTRVTVFVVSQDLYFDSIVGPDLPPSGPFQELYMTDKGLTTDVGPGDPGYVGGRWWVDVNGSRTMDAGDQFLSCPLLGKGSPTPPA